MADLIEFPKERRMTPERRRRIDFLTDLVAEMLKNAQLVEQVGGQRALRMFVLASKTALDEFLDRRLSAG
jgi:hypothetical protein